MICLWTGKVFYLAIGIAIVAILAKSAALALRETRTEVLNAWDEGIEWWRWFMLPAAFLQNLWEQFLAVIGGYESRIVRRHKEVPKP